MRPSAPSVLVVDDDEQVREFLSRGLERAGYVARQAASAAAALESMERELAALVLCDVRIPGKDGLWLAERLRAGWPLTPVVMITAIDDLFTVHRSRDLGVADYLTKPIKMEHLIAVVERYIGRIVRGPAPPDADPIPPGGGPALSYAPQAMPPDEGPAELEYGLESPVRCPACGERISSLKSVRLVPAPQRRGGAALAPPRAGVLACPHCLAIVTSDVTSQIA